jgi:putative oxidoreductase
MTGNFSSRRGRGASMALWTITVFLALEFLAAGCNKFAHGGAGWQTSFANWGLPLWLVPVAGVMEVGGALLILIPRLAVLGGYMLVAVMLGATGTHVVHGEWPRVVFTAILCTLAFVVARLRGSEFRLLSTRTVGVATGLLLVVW